MFKLMVLRIAKKIFYIILYFKLEIFVKYFFAVMNILTDILCKISILSKLEFKLDLFILSKRVDYISIKLNLLYYIQLAKFCKKSKQFLKMRLYSQIFKILSKQSEVDEIFCLLN